MDKFVKYMIGGLVIVAVGATVFFATLDKPYNQKESVITSDFEFVKESEYPMVSSAASMFSYGSLEEMSDVAVLIAEIYIKDQYVEYIGESTQIPATWSTAEIKQVYKGDKSLKEVKIGEVGGLVDTDQLKKVKGDLPVKQERFYEQTVEGSPVMKKGNTYIVLLGKGVYENTYEVVGGLQGKIRISDQTGKGVVTIDPDIFREHMNDLYWFQRKFAGKEKAEIAATLKSL